MIWGETYDGLVHIPFSFLRFPLGPSIGDLRFHFKFYGRLLARSINSIVQRLHGFQHFGITLQGLHASIDQIGGHFTYTQSPKHIAVVEPKSPVKLDSDSLAACC